MVVTRQVGLVCIWDLSVSEFYNDSDGIEFLVKSCCHNLARAGIRVRM